MKTREIGRSGLKIAPLALGTNVFGWTVDESTAYRLLDAFVGEGFNFIDTADVYCAWVPGNSGGESESIIGRWLQQSRNRTRVMIATKVGAAMGPKRIGLSKPNICRAIEDSLARLHTDYIDLYQSHHEDHRTPSEETLEAYSDLIEQGKVRAIGASNFTHTVLLRNLRISAERGLPKYQSLQPQYNLCDRMEYETKLEPICKEYGLGVLSYFSLASGFLTGKYRSQDDLKGRARSEYAEKYMTERGFKILQAVEQVARDLNSTPAAVSLAWLLARPHITASIASATNPDQLNSLLKAVELVMDDGSIQLLNEASAYAENDQIRDSA